MVSLAKYLQNPAIITERQNDQHDFFTLTTKNGMINYGKELMLRLFPKDLDNTNCEADPPVPSDSDICIMSTSSMKEQLNKAIASSMVDVVVAVKEDKNYKTMLREINLFEINGERTKNLQLLYDAIRTVKPTSTESERVFSLAGNFVTKIRSCLSDDSLNALVFLKSYFIKTKKL